MKNQAEKIENRKYNGQGKEKSPNSLTVTWAYPPTWLLLPKAMDELHNKPNLQLLLILLLLLLKDVSSAKAESDVHNISPKTPA